MTNRRKIQRAKHSQAKNTLSYQLSKPKKVQYEEKTMFYDPITGTLFRASKAEIDRVMRSLGYRCSGPVKAMLI